MFFDAGHETSGHGTKQIVSRLAVSSLICKLNLLIYLTIEPNYFMFFEAFDINPSSAY